MQMTDPPLAVLDSDDGILVHSFAFRDVGIDALAEQTAEHAIYRALLGDMRFVCERDPDGNLLELYFVAEFPNCDLGLRRRIATYFAYPLFEQDGEVVELMLGDSSLRILSWDDGISLLREATQRLSVSAVDTVTKIEEIDALIKFRRPNLSLDEMRTVVGPAPGARLRMSAALLGDVA